MSQSGWPVKNELPSLRWQIPNHGFSAFAKGILEVFLHAPVVLKRMWSMRP